MALETSMENRKLLEQDTFEEDQPLYNFNILLLIILVIDGYSDKWQDNH